MSRSLPRSSAAQAALAAVLVIGVMLLLVVSGHNDDERDRDQAAAEQTNDVDAPQELAGGFTTIPRDRFFDTLTEAQKASGGWHVAMATDENEQTVSVLGLDAWMDGDEPVMRGTTQGQSGPVVVVSVGDEVWFKGLGSRAKPWWRVPDKPAFAELRAFGDQDPFLEQVEDLDEFEVVGVEKIDGTAEDGSAVEVDAVHYRIEIEAMTQDGQGTAAATPVDMDVWVDEQDRPVQAITTLTLDGVRTQTTLIYSDYGRIAPIKAPPAAKVTDEVPAGYQPGQ